MMKKHLVLLLALLLSCLLLAGAAAEEAVDLSAQCKFKSDSSARKASYLTNGSFSSYWQSGQRRNPYLIIESPEPMYGLYLCFREMPDSYQIQRREGGEWVTIIEGDTRFHHVFYELDGESELRVYSTQKSKHRLVLNEVYVLGFGEVPSWVQRWEEPVEKADMLLLVAHPDDELIFFAGTLPTYAVEMGKRVVVAYLTYADKTRRSEALNGLWSMGIRNYPVFGPFVDKYSRSLKEAYQKIAGGDYSTGKKRVLTWVTELFRRYQPEVVLTQDIKGEYGHGQHRLVADACIQCFDLAANPEKYSASAGLYGVWEVKKLYIHLYGDETNQLHFAWDEPLASQGGKTGMQAAEEAFLQHVSQTGLIYDVGKRRVPLSVEEFGSCYDNTEFGLYATRVGDDVNKDDFLENID